MRAKINFRSALLATLLLLFAVLAPASAQASTLTPFAYVADGGEGAVQVINTATNARVASVPVPYSPWLERDVVSSPDGSMVYVSSEDNGVTAINTATNTVAWQMPSHFEESWSGETDHLPGLVIGMAVSPDGKYLYVSLGLDRDFGVIDTATHELVSVTYVNGCPAGIAVSPDGSRAYLANTCDESVQVINTALREVVATVATNNEPWAVAVNPKGGHAYVTGSKNGLVIDTTTNTVSGGFTDVAYPAGLAVTPNGKSVWAFGGPPPPPEEKDLGVPLSVIPTSGGGLWEAVMYLGLKRPWDVAITPDGQFAYVVDSDNENLTIVNTTTFEVEGYAPAGNQPTAVAITPPIEGEPEPSHESETPPSTDGGSSSGGSSTSLAPAPAPALPTSPKPKVLKCRKGFKKHKVHGKTRCVKVKKKHPR
jgi:YVTN family beta-propeller protein